MLDIEKSNNFYHEELIYSENKMNLMAKIIYN